MVEGKADPQFVRVLGKPQNKNWRPPPKQPTKCPLCNHTKLYKDGIRYLHNGKQQQRWLCRQCNYRFTIKPKNKTKHLDLSKHIKIDKNHLTNCRERDETHRGRAHNLQAEGYNLVNSKTHTITQRENTHQNNLNTTTYNEKNSKIIQYLWHLKTDGKNTKTITTYNGFLQTLAKQTDLTPDTVKTYIAEATHWSINTKRTITAILKGYYTYHNINWKPPHYRAEDTITYIPPEQDIDTLIAGCGRKLATCLQLLKETGARIEEATKIEWTEIDKERKQIQIAHPGKGSKTRTLPISDKLIGMLNRIPHKNKKIFATARCVKSNFYTTRRTLATKLQNPRLTKIHLHTFRHWKATNEYHKTKDILHVKYILGHRKIENTMIYIDIEASTYKTTDNSYTGKIATTEEDMIELTEAGYEYVTDITGGKKLFRKRK